MVEVNILVHLFSMLQDRNGGVRPLAVKAITDLVKFGWLIYYFCTV
jgi:hypothetical protein